MKLDALDHPKTFDLASRLGVSRPTVIGHLELLWAFTGKYAVQGNIGKLADGAIARGCDWLGDPQVFVNALLESGFIDADREHRLVIHDWPQHCHSWVKAKLAKVGLSFITTSERSVEATREPTKTPSTSEAKPRQAKPSLLPTDASRPREILVALKAVYPKRAGAQPWARAEKAISARLREGVEAEAILDGAARYAEFMQATGKEGTEYVMQAATFCGPDKHFLEPWELPLTKAESEQAQRISAGREWLEDSKVAPF